MLALDPAEERLIRLLQETLEITLLLRVQRAVALLQKAPKQEVKLQEAAPALPAQASQGFILDSATHSTRLSSS